MTITDEELAAFADGELSGEEAERVAAAVRNSPEVSAKLEQHRALRANLAAHFAPILDQEVPGRLSDLLKPQANVVDLSSARETSVQKRSVARWGWIAGPALAASLAIVLLFPRESDLPGDYADQQLAAVLEQQLVAEQDAAAETRILLSFEREDGNLCRAFASSAMSGIACKDEHGWAFVEQMEGIAPTVPGYRQAGNAQSELMAVAQEMATKGALDQDGERAARSRDWQAP
ncbi:hypothetical protein M3P36_05905 [Altererythrobacter sp. KTW20L]|uniref:anti-sigma factor family protein n=1 Tax=Altererythrobacter sp. KTW20L TaxID=2942210 RepID=UPI0020C0D547|nr:hypothetical protein [Altererythrobacter sp. KTW20L]MCL6250576.1 hypothetical protein [Altererythrobacter sp. KTW20L]